MPAFICTTCGTQYRAERQAAAACPICDDERHFVPPARPSLDHARQPAEALHQRLARARAQPLLSITTLPAVRHRPARAACCARRPGQHPVGLYHS